MPSANDDPLLLSTLHARRRGSTAPRPALPCLTIVGHHDPARVGERALLRGLLVAQPTELSRAQPAFAQPSGGEPRPLLDPHLSRTPVRLHKEGTHGIRVDANGTDLCAEGSELTGSRTFSPDELERGVVLELADRVVLLLHRTQHRELTEVDGLIGQSDAIDDVRLEVMAVADLDTPVLLRGETGTGKELIARAIHAHSARRAAQFVAVNMAAVPEATAVSTLFGHARGAFTGAHQRHVGLFERASGGTLLLDEIGDTPQPVQPMLLRAIETRHILPLGETSERKVDVRLVAATDADLERELSERSFSAALLHRLAGYAIHVPALRERREDIALLLVRFLSRELAAAGEPGRLADLLALLVSSGLLARVVRAPLPGNVRQLQNLARHLVISNRGRSHLVIADAVQRLLGDLESEAPPPAALPAAAPTSPRRESERPSASAARRASERPSINPRAQVEISDEQLVTALRAHGWSPGRTAASLGLPTGTLHDLMRRSGHVRRAADVSDDELRETYDACAGDTAAMAEKLSVSERGLRITLRQRGLLTD